MPNVINIFKKVLWWIEREIYAFDRLKYVLAVHFEYVYGKEVDRFSNEYNNIVSVGIWSVFAQIGPR